MTPRKETELTKEYMEEAKQIIAVLELDVDNPNTIFGEEDLSKFLARRDEARDAQLIEKCAGVAESEPELPGEPEPECLAAMIEAGPLMNARIAVKTTKECIAERIRALASPSPASSEPKPEPTFAIYPTKQTEKKPSGEHSPDCLDCDEYIDDHRKE